MLNQQNGTLAVIADIFHVKWQTMYMTNILCW